MDKKQSEEILAEIYRNAQLALTSIADITPQVDDHETRTELAAEHEEYERIAAKAAVIAKDHGIELKEPNAFKKAMMWGSIKMSTLTDNSRSHIAEMMIQGTVMGITSLKTTQGKAECNDEEICSLLSEMIAMEEKYEKRLKTFL